MNVYMWGKNNCVKIACGNKYVNLKESPEHLGKN